MNEKQTDELDKFMTSLENAGILKGWSKFIRREKPDRNDSSKSKKKRETYE